MSESRKTRLSRYGQRERRAQTLGQPRRAWLHTRQLDRCRTGISRARLPKSTAADFAIIPRCSFNSILNGGTVGRDVGR